MNHSRHHEMEGAKTVASQGTVRLWHQSMTELEHLEEYRTTLENHARAVLPEGTEVAVRGMPAGSYGGMAPSDVLGYPYAYHGILSRVTEAAYQAQEQGYDAFVVGSYSEPYLREIRSLVDIPVASLAESTFLVGCSLGKYQALIANVPDVARIVRGSVEKHGLRDRVAGVYSLDPPLNEPELVRAYHDPGPLLDGFTRIAQQSIDAGADVIIPAEGVLSELVYANGLRNIGDVPVVDSLGVAWHYAQMLVGLWRQTGLRLGRRWEYAQPSAQMVAHVRELTRSTDLTF
jgi:allantoin racemase